MPDYLQRESNKITIANFFEGYQLEKYNFEPPYQRRSLWTEEKKSFLIDSILKNYPMPPIFLHQKIDDTTGKTKYDVIDGKQRLTAIVEFIENKIPVADESDETLAENAIAGLYFEDLDDPAFASKKSLFWRYVIPIEYVDTGEPNVIDSIFDRLNRNGEPLTGQELRNANYYGTPLLDMLEDLAKEPFWQDLLSKVDRTRMEDIEFLSELVFLVLEGQELQANQAKIDELYRTYADNPKVDYEELMTKFMRVSDYMRDLELPYAEWRINGVSHLYGMFSFCHYCVTKDIPAADVKDRLTDFFDRLRNRDYTDNYIHQYKESMSARTKSNDQRKKRTQALIGSIVQGEDNGDVVS